MASSDGGSFDRETGEPEEGEGETNDESAADALGGWVPPEKRAWRHPSELASPWPPYAAPTVRGRPPGRRSAWATTLVGAGAVAALVTGGLMLATQSRPAEAPGSSTAPPASATRSIVRLEVGTSRSSTYGCGVVVAGGGMVATNATLLAGAKWVMATTASGRRERATVIAVDTHSDVGIVRVDASLPVAHFVDWSEVQPGTGAVEMDVASVSRGSATAMWSEQTIDSTSDAVGTGPGSGMVSVVAGTPRGVAPVGAVLMEPDGAIVGLLDRYGVPEAGDGSAFLPGELVLQVARELMRDGKIQHGWLGIAGTDSGSSEPAGALVSAVDPNGASSDRLERGDVIEAIDGHRVQSMADLSSRLYMLAPGTWVELRVDRDHTVQTIGLWLESSP